MTSNFQFPFLRYYQKQTMNSITDQYNMIQYQTYQLQVSQVHLKGGKVLQYTAVSNHPSVGI